MGNNNSGLVPKLCESLEKNRLKVDSVQTIFNKYCQQQHPSSPSTTTTTTVTLHQVTEVNHFVEELFEYTWRTVTPHEIATKLVPVQTGQSITLVRKSFAVIPEPPVNVKQSFVSELSRIVTRAVLKNGGISWQEFQTLTQSTLSNTQ